MSPTSCQTAPPRDIKEYAIFLYAHFLSCAFGGLVLLSYSTMQYNKICIKTAWRRPTLAEVKPRLPSALESLTTVFEMGTGVASLPKLPDNFNCLLMILYHQN